MEGKIKHDLCLIVTNINTKKERTVWRWVREQDGIKYILYKGSIWKVSRYQKIFNSWYLERPMILS